MSFNYKIFLDWMRGYYTEMIDEQVDMFNTASDGCLSLVGSDFEGSLKTNTFWPIPDNMVQKRNVFSNENIDDVEITDDEETKVKIAAGTKRLITRPSDARWINMSEREAARVWGIHLAQYSIQDMTHTAILALTASIEQEGATLINDITSSDQDTMNLRALNRTSGKFGDRAGAIRCWITHSTPFNDLIDNNLANSENLFSFGTVNIRTDASGKRFIVTDAPYLVDDSASSVYSVFGLTSNAVTVEGPNNWLSASERKTGKTNIYDAFQAEWTYNLKVKGYSWNGGSDTVSSPDDPAIGSSANWLKKRTSHKDLPGVILKCN